MNQWNKSVGDLIAEIKMMQTDFKGFFSGLSKALVIYAFSNAGGTRELRWLLPAGKKM